MNITEDPIMNMLLDTQTELIETYVEAHSRLVAIDAPVEMLAQVHDEYKRVMDKLNMTIERQRLINQMK